MRILVTGSRGWTDSSTIGDALAEFDRQDVENPTLVSGACPTGADRAADLGADVCLAFIGACTSPHASHGASHTADMAEKTGIPVRRFLATTRKAS